MADGTVHFTSEGGVAGAHVRLPDSALLVGPTVEKEFNTLKAGLIPIACWRVEDLRFKFASSFVEPEIANEIKALHKLREEHKKEKPLTKPPTKPQQELKKEFLFPPLSIFGHADPVGEDEFNKQLSGRRATAIYALLTRRTDLWEELFSQPLANDKWGEVSIRTIQTHLGLEPTGKADKATRKALFGAYMELLCTIRDNAGDPQQEADGSPKVLILDKEKDFLGQGKDSGGKADFQGCGEFNPVLIFSKEEEQAFAAAQDKTVRNRENGRNRRVVALLFRVGSKVEPTKWPCPRVKEGTGACRKRFWSDGEMRRNKRLEGQRREYQENKDTFACRFFDRLNNKSPCERILEEANIVLYDPFGKPIPNAPFETVIEGQGVQQGVADDTGVATLRHIIIPTECHLRWGVKSENNEPVALIFSQSVFLDIDDGPNNDDNKTQEECRKKLNNLGYGSDVLSENVKSFQADSQLQVTGNLDKPTVLNIRRVYDKMSRSS